MKIVVAFLSIVLWLMYAGQVVSAVRFSLAQRLGLQEKPDGVDPLHCRLELLTARWDLCWLWVLPLAGTLMLLDHPWWPYAALIGGGAYVDAGGREAAKILGLRQQSVRTGTPAEHRLSVGVYGFLIAIGVLGIAAGLIEAT